MKLTRERLRLGVELGMTLDDFAAFFDEKEEGAPEGATKRVQFGARSAEICRAVPGGRREAFDGRRREVSRDEMAGTECGADAGGTDRAGRRDFGADGRRRADDRPRGNRGGGDAGGERGGDIFYGSGGRALYVARW